MCRLARILTGWLLLTSGGCAFLPVPVPAPELARRILPPPSSPTSPAAEQLPITASKELDPAETQPAVPSREQTAPPAACPVACPEGGSLSLEQAIELALASNPTLEVFDERVAAAEGGQTASFASFLPESRLLYRHIESSPGTETFALPTMPTNLVGNIAFGGQSDRFDLTELHLQWTLCDFGRRAGRYGQAKVAVQIARLQYQRARQTVAFNVAARYFAVLQAQATMQVAEEAVRRAEVDLRDARNFLRRGTKIRSDVLRAEVFLAESKLALIKARTARGVAVAGLNQAIGINVSDATAIVDRPSAPPFALALDRCLQLAVANRQEFGVVLDTIRSARLGVDVARADFMPKVLVGGVAANEDSNPHEHADVVSGGLSIELTLFEGGRRVGHVRTAEAEARGATAQGKEVCDRISYEVNVAYLSIAEARESIAQASAAISAATENLRVVRGQVGQGDVSPTDVVDAEWALTRAQQSYYIALYDYQIALVQLAYADGLPILSNLTGSPEGLCHE
jgi:outer membrane protein